MTAASLDTDGVLNLMREVSARVIEPRFRALADEQIDQKKPGDFVTIADRESEEQLTAALGAAFPGCVVVGEEAVFANPRLVDGLPEIEHLFLVDPVDGTANFVAGNPDHAVMVAEVRRGEATRGWILQPALGHAYVAEQGSGLWLDGVRVSRARAHQGAPVGMGSTKRYPLRSDSGLPPLEPTFRSCGIDYPAVADGRMDFVMYHSLSPWDHVPGTLMVRETGGVARTIHGAQDYRVGITEGGLLVAADPATWDTVWAAIERE